jgi:hypothetical protein
VTEKYTLRRVITSGVTSDVTSGLENDREQSIVFTLRREGDEVAGAGKFSRLFRIKVDHPTDDNLRIEVQVDFLFTSKLLNVRNVFLSIKLNLAITFLSMELDSFANMQISYSNLLKGTQFLALQSKFSQI